MKVISLEKIQPFMQAINGKFSKPSIHVKNNETDLQCVAHWLYQSSWYLQQYKYPALKTLEVSLSNESMIL